MRLSKSIITFSLTFSILFGAIGCGPVMSTKTEDQRKREFIRELDQYGKKRWGEKKSKSSCFIVTASF